MKSRPILIAGITILASLVAEVANGQTPLGTEFTYQGQLKNSGAPLNATADFEFRLFNDPSAGTQVGSTNPVSNVNVVDGLFTATLNFGSSPFVGDKRWLDVRVRSPAGSGNFTTLTPRQLLTAAPFALYALSGPGSGGPWAVSGNTVFNTNTGNVGIGATSPTHPLHVRASLPLLNLQDADSVGAQHTGYVRFADSGNVERGFVGYGSELNTDLSVRNLHVDGATILGAGGGAQFSLAPNGNVSIQGNVGVGTSSPASKLDVRGNIRLGTSGQFFALAGEENLRIVRGDIGGNGAILRGAGFTCQRSNDGVYDITFTPSFSASPSVTVTAHALDRTVSHAPFFLSANSARVLIMANGSLSDTDFSLCVIGPR